ncbi:MAG: quinolinate synthase NadA [Deltaproteobacteria bacterium]|jgi:quinolinate synthase|nr:quinolinate synthase NadA [Deltaproteobacteria bacterium]
MTGTTGGAQNLPDDLEGAIADLKREKGAVILAHYYQESEIQDLADVVGDSLALARAAQEIDCELIVFCGVHFMAETAAILNPGIPVVVPDLEAGCSLADGCPPEEFKEFVAAHPGARVLTYINASAGVKAMSDLICTSSNAVKMVEHFAGEKLIFAPDRHLARWVAKETGRDDLIVWPGACVVHEQFSAKRLARLNLEHPDRPAIVATEDGVFHAIQKQVPDKVLIQAPGIDESCACNRCPFMRLNTLEKLYLCLRDEGPRVTVPEELAKQALLPIERMLALS